jgi:hypothetical protein
MYDDIQQDDAGLEEFLFRLAGERQAECDDFLARLDALEAAAVAAGEEWPAQTDSSDAPPF